MALGSLCACDPRRTALRARRRRYEKRPCRDADGGDAIRAASRRHAGTLAFLITSDEEGPSVDGTKRVMELLAARGVRIRWCIVGEPSSEASIGDTIKVGRRGSLSARLTVHGVQGHVAYPALADNPIHRFAPALAELAARVWDQGNAHFQPTSFQVSNLNAGTGAPNVIPGELKARINLRYSPVQTLDSLKRTVTGVLERHQVKHTLEWYVSGEPFFTPPGKLSAAVSAAVADGGRQAARAHNRRRNLRRPLHCAAAAPKSSSSVS